MHHRTVYQLGAKNGVVTPPGDNAAPAAPTMSAIELTGSPTLNGKDLLLAIQRQVVTVFIDDHLCDD